MLNISNSRYNNVAGLPNLLLKVADSNQDIASPVINMMDHESMLVSRILA